MLYGDVQSVPQGQGLKCKIEAIKIKIIGQKFGYITILYFCKKSLMVINPAYICSIFLIYFKLHFMQF